MNWWILMGAWVVSLALGDTHAATVYLVGALLMRQMEQKP